ncbi:right-handed parallel beta-helix repeat-containing protein [Mariniphaga sediminis]|uniref:Right-handed parallel beta-helix repeat-containing protein n=1 Tax=Mariniphaga sediminis TaxID=1628158 RepID=A0A399CWZ7_9BACT|nr:right-handed parallel beta-helix repeat-containing protein [Mariniphaga sediminis]RIH63746.1 right-handed parallel beta-helix repeat-containing protein [Mariniphaga sediminis]
MRNKLTGIILLLIIVVHIGCTTQNRLKNYYISPDGNDDNTGLTKKTAWKTLERVNRETFHPGDAILFESGGTWNGHLRPLGSGERGKMITISSYEEGSMPVINIGEGAGAGISLVDQSWWEIQGIEITSGALPQLGVRREGISIKAEKGDSIKGITVRDCYIHDLWGQIGGSGSSTMIEINRVTEDVLVENNTIKRCDKIGIKVTGRKNIVVRRNYLENLGGDGIILHGAYRGLIEYNIVDQTCLRTGDPHLDTGDDSRYAWWPHTAAIWMSHAKETIMQFNEVYNTGRQPGNGDGQAFDFDFNCENNILQYNYSRNNAGFLLIMDNTHENIARYNISQNDIKFRPTQLVTMFCDTAEQNLLHNNVFYVDHGTSDITYYYGDEYGPDKGKGKKEKGKLGAHFRNNIFYATGQGRFRTVYAQGDSLNSAEFRKLEDFHKLSPPKYGTRFFNNLYFGPWINGLPDDPKKNLADPMFISAGSGRYGFSSLDGYKLKSGSPCFNKAVFIETGNICDFYGNPVINGSTNIGVYEEVDDSKVLSNTY